MQPADLTEHIALNIHGKAISCAGNGAGQFVLRTSGDLLFNNGSLTPQWVGSFDVTRIDVIGAVIEDESVYEVFETSHKTRSLFEKLYRMDLNYRNSVIRAAFNGDPTIADNPNLLIIEQLTIKPGFRNGRFGFIALKAIIREFRVGMGLIVGHLPQMDSGTAEPRESARAVKCNGYRLGHDFEDLRFARLPGSDLLVRDAVLSLTSPVN